MRQKKEWECWTLSQEEIEQQAVRMGLDPVKFTEHDLEVIADYFKDMLGSSFDDWPEILGEAITLHQDQKKYAEEESA